MLREWMADESGYDERTWPTLKVALDSNRRVRRCASSSMSRALVGRLMRRGCRASEATP